MLRPLIVEQIPDIQEAIKLAAWRQIAESEAHSLSLKAVARELGITLPAIYIYFQDRDSLLTALFFDAYLSFSDHQLAVCELFPGPEMVLERCRAIGVAYREWALTNPQRYRLIFGPPIPGFSLPMEQIRPVMLRSLSALVGVIGELHVVGRLNVDYLPLLDAEVIDNFFFGPVCLTPEDEIIYSMAMLIWSRVHGLVSLELNGQIPSFGNVGNALFGFEFDTIIRQFVTL
jgi:AcrR family transcriptional regulator